MVFAFRQRLGWVIEADGKQRGDAVDDGVLMLSSLPAGPPGRRHQQRSGARKTRAQRCRSPVFHSGPSIVPAVFSALAPGHDRE